MREEAVSKLCERVDGTQRAVLDLRPPDWQTISESPGDKPADYDDTHRCRGRQRDRNETTPGMTAKDAHANFVSAEGTKTFRSCTARSAIGGKADIAVASCQVLDPRADINLSHSGIQEGSPADISQAVTGSTIISRIMLGVGNFIWCFSGA